MQALTQENGLTEKEILGSLPSDYMNERQLEFFRARLNAMRAELKGNADRTADNLRNEILHSYARLAASVVRLMLNKQ
jgi:hypothetical protein